MKDVDTAMRGAGGGWDPTAAGSTGSAIANPFLIKVLLARCRQGLLSTNDCRNSAIHVWHTGTSTARQAAPATAASELSDRMEGTPARA
ncbi:hypothetical protein DFJ73DRAFT_783614 [Zopfochytrium polystomum]|nr:hypothetical protein DFJ73DRAFT_783614 [Zopfochytrium polystomum]